MPPRANKGAVPKRSRARDTSSDGGPSGPPSSCSIVRGADDRRRHARVVDDEGDASSIADTPSGVTDGGERSTVSSLRWFSGSDMSKRSASRCGAMKWASYQRSICPTATRRRAGRGGGWCLGLAIPVVVLSATGPDAYAAGSDAVGGNNQVRRARTLLGFGPRTCAQRASKAPTSPPAPHSENWCAAAPQSGSGKNVLRSGSVGVRRRTSSNS